jgi:hypothetical protein
LHPMPLPAWPATTELTATGAFALAAPQGDESFGLRWPLGPGEGARRAGRRGTCSCEAAGWRG